MSDPRERASLDPRDVFMKDLNLPRGPERQRVRRHAAHMRIETTFGYQTEGIVGPGLS
jgi:hypothetical protein